MDTHCLTILKSEVKPALGCTEPVAVALCCGRAKDELNDIPDKVEVFVSKNVLKNGMGVYVPNTDMVGLDIAAAVGSLIGNSHKGLNILEDVDDKLLLEAKNFLKNDKIKIFLKETKDKLYIESILYKGDSYVKVIIKDKHDRIIYVERNGNVIVKDEIEEIAVSSKSHRLSIKEIYEFATSVNFEEIAFLLEGVEMNKKIAQEGLDKNYGLNVGKNIIQNIKKGILSDDIHNFAMALTAAGADARMSGATLPVMSSAGSGNQGLTAILPVVAVSEKLNCSKEKLARAIAIRHLITYHIKTHLGRLSPVCGCGVAAGIGASCAITYLLGGAYDNITKAIKNMVAGC